MKSESFFHMWSRNCLPFRVHLIPPQVLSGIRVKFLLNFNCLIYPLEINRYMYYVCTGTCNLYWNRGCDKWKVNVLSWFQTNKYLLLLLAPTSFGHGVVCPSSIYSLWLALCIFKLFSAVTHWSNKYQFYSLWVDPTGVRTRGENGNLYTTDIVRRVYKKVIVCS